MAEKITTRVLKRMFKNNHRMSLLIDFFASRERVNYIEENASGEKEITQAGHGFTVKQAIRYDGESFVLACADSAENAQTVGIVVKVTDTDTFVYKSAGYFENEEWTAGTEYFLSPSTAGLVDVEPESWNIGEVRQSLGWGTPQGLKIEIDVGDEIEEYTVKVKSDLSIGGEGTDDDPLQLVNDQDAPGNYNFYGTGSTGTKGFYSFLTALLSFLTSATSDTIDDADTFNFVKSDTLSKTTWSTIKSTLKTYFDTVYSTFSGSWSDLTDKPSTIWNYSVQSLSGTAITLDVDNGLNATVTLSADTTITMSNVVAGMTGNLTVTNAATAYTVEFALTGATIKVSPVLTATSGVITMSGDSEKDVLSWYYDGTNLFINGTLAYL